jgi:hypothetical protein
MVAGHVWRNLEMARFLGNEGVEAAVAAAACFAVVPAA